MSVIIGKVRYIQTPALNAREGYVWTDPNGKRIYNSILISRMRQAAS